MAIRINLLAEEQAAEELRRKNPVKLTIWVGSFFVAVVAIIILKIQWDIGFSKKAYNLIEQSWKNNTANYAAVTNNIAKIAVIDKKLAALDRLSTNRFYWAPVLNALQQTMIGDIQVVRVAGEQKYTKIDPKTIGSGQNVKTIPGSMIEKTTLYIDANDYNPGAQNYDKFKETLNNFDFFVSNLQHAFILEGTLSPPTADPSDPSRQFVVFKLVSHFKDVSRE
jgi:hypothetical protein